jgi:hypothetical protein
MSPPDRDRRTRGPLRRSSNDTPARGPSSNPIFDVVSTLGNRGAQVLAGALDVATHLDWLDPTVLDPDHPVVEPPPAADRPDEPLVPIDDHFTPQIDDDDPTTFWTPPETTRDGIAGRLYGDRSHVGGFEIIGDKHVRLRSFDGVADDVAAAMRAKIEEHLLTDIHTVVDILCQRLVLGGDEWRLLETTVRWSSRSELKDTLGESYFDRYLDALAARTLTEERPWPSSDIDHSALDWLLDEAEEKASAIYPLIARRSTHKELAKPELAPVIGPMGPGTVVGQYAFRLKRPALAIGKWDYRIGDIGIAERLVDETSATRAETALRNTAHHQPRVMIPGGDGHFYGYTISFPRLEQGYTDPSEHWYTNKAPQHIDNWWWHYSGIVVIEGGEFQPDFGPGGEAEHAQRAEILARAMAAGADEQRSLDFDALSLATLDQRMILISSAIKRHEDADASLIARVLYATPATDFPVLERRMSTGGAIGGLVRMGDPGGRVAMIGRIFTVKSIESMQVTGESLQHLPELTTGFDDDGYFHGGDFVATETVSHTVASADMRPGEEVALGHERALPGEAPSQFTRSLITIRPRIIRLGSLVGMMSRHVIGTFSEAEGSDVGPMLPTQLVRVTVLGPKPETHIVTALEAVGLLTGPAGEIYGRALSATVRGYMWITAGVGLVRAFGPALAEGLVAGSETRGVAAALLEAAGTKVGTSALLNTAAIAGMEAIERNRDLFGQTDAGRAFLELYDITMLIWVSHDVARLIGSGLVPRLASAIDGIIAFPGALRDAVMPLRDEIEAMRRAIARYSSTAEAAEAATAGSSVAGVAPAAEQRPGFFAALRVARGEVASERLIERLAGGASQPVARRVLSRLGSLAERSERAAADLTADAGERAAATKRGTNAARARLAIAQRATQLRGDVRDAFLDAVDRVMSSRPNSLDALTDLLAAAAGSRQPTVFLAEVQRLVNRSGVTREALTVLGQKVREGTLDLVWLNRTSISEETLDFLGRDRRTPWDLYRRAAQTPSVGNVMRSFRTSARGAGAELVAADEAAKLGTNVRRQVPMGTHELDYEITVSGRPHGFEVKGWTPDTWKEALDAAIQRLNKRGLSAEERKALGKIDTMLDQLRDAQATTGTAPYLGVTDGLEEAELRQLRRILEANGLGQTTFVPLSEDAIKEAAAGTIGERVGVPRP